MRRYSPGALTTNTNIASGAIAPDPEADDARPPAAAVARWTHETNR